MTEPTEAAKAWRRAWFAACDSPGTRIKAGNGITLTASKRTIRLPAQFRSDRSDTDAS